jgi:hypothetical protein
MKRIIFLFGLLILTSCTYNEITPICEPDEQIFSDLVQPIIESNCIQCHSESGIRPETPLEIYEGVIDALNNHSLRDKVSSLQMPPYGAPPLSESDINIIKNWADCE